MKVEANCPNGHSIKAPPSAVGKRVKCPKCACVFRLTIDDPSTSEMISRASRQPSPGPQAFGMQPQNSASPSDGDHLVAGEILTGGGSHADHGLAAGDAVDQDFGEADLPQAFGDAQFSAPVMNSAAYAPKIKPTPEPEVPPPSRPGFSKTLIGLALLGVLGIVGFVAYSTWQAISNDSIHLADASEGTNSNAEADLANTRNGQPRIDIQRETLPNANRAGAIGDRSNRDRQFPGQQAAAQQAAAQQATGNSDPSNSPTATKFSLPDVADSSDGDGLANRVQRSKTKVLFGFDRDRRAVFSSYLQAHGFGKGNAGVTILKVLGRLNGVAKVLGLEPDEYNYVDLPADAFTDFRRVFESGELFATDDFQPNLPDELTMIRDDYENARLEGVDLQNAFLICLAYWVEE